MFLFHCDFGRLAHNCIENVNFRSRFTDVQVMGLRKAIIQQAKDFLENFHERCSCELQAHMENEQWAAVNVPEQMQAVVDSLLAGLDSPTTDASAAAARDVPENEASVTASSHAPTTMLQELRSHRQSIFAKLLEIMLGRMTLHLSAVQRPQWEFSEADAVTSPSRDPLRVRGLETIEG